MTDAVLAPLAEVAREGAAELRELAPMLARLGPIEGPTRRQKRTWRRRVSRARWTQHHYRGAFGAWCSPKWIVLMSDCGPNRHIAAPWER